MIKSNMKIKRNKVLENKIEKKINNKIFKTKQIAFKKIRTKFNTINK
jgi:hypothetical protein